MVFVPPDSGVDDSAVIRADEKRGKVGTTVKKKGREHGAREWCG